MKRDFCFGRGRRITDFPHLLSSDVRLRFLAMVILAIFHTAFNDTSVDSLSRFTHTVFTFTTRNLWFESVLDKIETSFCSVVISTTRGRRQQNQINTELAILALKAPVLSHINYLFAA